MPMSEAGIPSFKAPVCRPTSSCRPVASTLDPLGLVYLWPRTG
jgi:hypothetical protein